jgi:hypothetical protein
VPCPVTIVDSFMFVCSRWFSRPTVVGKNDFVTAPLVDASHSHCHSSTPSSFSSLTFWLRNYFF